MPEAPRRRTAAPGDVRAALAAGFTGVLLGVAVGLAWEALAPTPVVREVGGVLVSDTMPEFAAAQDGTFALLAVGAGLLHGMVLVARRPARPLPATLGALLGGALGGVLAWRLGALLGPPALAVQAETAEAVLRAPLDLQAYGVLGLWPAALAAVVFAGLLATGLSAGDRRAGRGREPHQVRRGELDVQAPSTRTDENRR